MPAAERVRLVSVAMGSKSVIAFLALHAALATLAGCASSVMPDGSDTMPDGSDAADVAAESSPWDSGCGRAPRLVAPLSTSWVSGTTQAFVIDLGSATSATVEICSDRTCSHLTNSIRTSDGRASIDSIAAGTSFWRASTSVGGCTASSPVWQFTRTRSLAVPSLAWGSTADLNADGFSDVVLAGWAGSHVVEFVPGGLGGPDWSRAAMPVQPPDNVGDVAARAVDLNGDGYGDAVLGASFPSGLVVVYGGSGAPDARAVQRLNVSTVGNEFPAVAGVGDIDGDGYGDLVGVDRRTAMVSIFYGSTTGFSSNPDAMVAIPNFFSRPPRGRSSQGRRTSTATVSMTSSSQGGTQEHTTCDWPSSAALPAR